MDVSAQTIDALQVVSLIGFIALGGLSAVAFRQRSSYGRLYILPVITYAAAGIVYYWVVVFVPASVPDNWRMLGSVVLRLISLIMAGAYVALARNGHHK